eukprot:5626265-Pyramimonas_sp.AAC.2
MDPRNLARTSGLSSTLYCGRTDSRTVSQQYNRQSRSQSTVKCGASQRGVVDRAVLRGVVDRIAPICNI